MRLPLARWCACWLFTIGVLARSFCDCDLALLHRGEGEWVGALAGSLSNRVHHSTK
jgi:hypothetical protein